MFIIGTESTRVSFVMKRAPQPLAAVFLFLGLTMVHAASSMQAVTIQLVPERGHTDAVQAVAFARDKTVAVTVGGTEVVAWDLATGVQLRQFRGHTDIVRAIAVSGNNVLVTGSSDGTARIWNLATGAEVRRIVVSQPRKDLHAEGVRAISFLNGNDAVELMNQDYSAYSNRKQFVTTWDIRLGRELKRFQLRPDYIDGAGFSKDGKYFAARYRGTSGMIKDGKYLPVRDRSSLAVIYSTNTGRLISTTKVDPKLDVGAIVNSILISPTNRQYALLGMRSISVHDLQNGRLAWTAHFDDDEVSAATYIADGTRLLVTTKHDAFRSHIDKTTLRILDGRTGAALQAFEIGHSEIIYDGQTIIGTKQSGFGTFIESIKAIDSNQLFVTESGEEQYRIDLKAGGRIITAYKSRIEPVQALAINDDATRLALGTNYYAAAWNLQSGRIENWLGPFTERSGHNFPIINGPFLDMHFSVGSPSKLVVATSDAIFDDDLIDNNLKRTSRRGSSGYVEARRDDAQLALVSNNKLQRANADGQAFAREVSFATGSDFATLGSPILVGVRLGMLPQVFGPAPSVFSPSGDIVFGSHDQRVCRLSLHDHKETCFPNVVTYPNIAADLTAFATNRKATELLIAYSAANQGAAVAQLGFGPNDLMVELIHQTGVLACTRFC